MDYSAMKMEDLRREGRQAGFSSKFVTFAAKKDLVSALENGKEPMAYNTSTGDDLADILANALQGKIKTGIDEDVVRDIVRQELTGVTNAITIEIKDISGKITEIGKAHCKTATMIKHAMLRHNMLLVGPAGSGKTTACSKVAEALSLPFSFISVGQQTTKSDLIGYVGATGAYVKTALRTAYEDGGVFLLDELDAGNSNVVIVLNALLDSKTGAFPDGMITRHPDFICIAAANTYGHGGNSTYIGRNQLDASTMDRFVVIDFPYDEVLELSITGHSAWTLKVQALRSAAADLKEKIVISPRASIKGVAMLAAGFSESEILESIIWKGINRDIVSRVTNHAKRC